LTFWPKLEILSKIKIVVNNWNFGQKYTFLVKYWNFGQKFKFWSIAGEIFDWNLNFLTKFKFLTKFRFFFGLILCNFFLVHGENQNFWISNSNLIITAVFCWKFHNRKSNTISTTKNFFIVRPVFVKRLHSILTEFQNLIRLKGYELNLCKLYFLKIIFYRNQFLMAN